MIIPITNEEKNILIDLVKKVVLKLKKLSFFKNINNNIELNQDEMLVAIGIITNPILLKKIILISIISSKIKTWKNFY